MGLRSQEVRNIFSGVSTLPQSQRTEAHWNELLNTMVYDGRLMGRRPSTFHTAQLNAIGTGSPVTFPIIRSATEKYTAVIQDGDIAVYDGFDGAAMTIHRPNGTAYLSVAPLGFRWVTVGDKTILTNRKTLTSRGITTAPTTEAVSLVTVRQGNFGTKYTISIWLWTGSLFVQYPVDYTTPASSAAAAEEAIDTKAIATQLFTLLGAEAAFTGVCTFVQTGSTIAIYPVNPNVRYKVGTEDGLGNEGLFVCNETVQRFEDLPLQAPEGTILEVVGDASTPLDNYWVQFDSDNGVWVEVTAPDALLGFDKSTMPHLLEYAGTFVDATEHDGNVSTTVFTNADLALTVNALIGKRIVNVTDGSEATILSNTVGSITSTALSGGGVDSFRLGDLVEVRDYGEYFIFRQAPWADRTVGDTNTNRYPSFVGDAIKDVEVIQGRLVIITDNSIVTSRIKDLFNVFRNTTTRVEPDGPIDITETLPSSSKFHAITEWDGTIIVWTDLGQYELAGEPVLAPDTVSLKRLTQYPNLSTVRPVAAGVRIFFVGLTNGRPQVMEMVRSGEDSRPLAQSVVKEIPGYLVGTPLALEADEVSNILLVLTQDGTATNLYALTYVLEGGQRAQQAWSRWELDCNVLFGLPDDVYDAVLGL